MTGGTTLLLDSSGSDLACPRKAGREDSEALHSHGRCVDFGLNALSESKVKLTGWEWSSIGLKTPLSPFLLSPGFGAVDLK